MTSPESLIYGPTTLRTTELSHSLEAERRHQARITLALEAYLICPDDGKVVRARTKNISSDGFYCLARQGFTPGNLIQSFLLFHGLDPADRARIAFLDCVAKVVRVEAKDGGVYGIACQIIEYRLGHGDPPISTLV